MRFLERNMMVTIKPSVGALPEHLSRFQWEMHVSLPYPFPSKTCHKQTVEVADRKYDFSIHNHFTRVISTYSSGEKTPPHFRVHLEDNRKPRINYPANVSVSRESLQAAVIFQEEKEYDSAAAAFDGAEAKINECMGWLASFLSACQRAAPYLTSWLVYPISMFDVGTVYHNVTAYCAKHDRREPLLSAMAVSAGRQLQQPMFTMEPPTQVDDTSAMATTNELLAEAMMSLLRGMPRLAVLNSYTAVESLANVVFLQTKVAMLVGNNVPPEIAHTLVEDERKRHRTDPAFLYHKGMKSACGRSLMEENQAQYDALLKLQEMRHKVAHTGYKPTADEARAAHKTCCEVATWLAEIAGFETKGMLPTTENTYSGFSTAFKDAQVQNESEVQLLRSLLSRVKLPAQQVDG